jgi:hypothetical protein
MLSTPLEDTIESFDFDDLRQHPWNPFCDSTMEPHSSSDSSSVTNSDEDGLSNHALSLVASEDEIVSQELVHSTPAVNIQTSTTQEVTNMEPNTQDYINASRLYTTRDDQEEEAQQDLPSRRSHGIRRTHAQTITAEHEQVERISKRRASPLPPYMPHGMGMLVESILPTPTGLPSISSDLVKDLFQCMSVLVDHTPCVNKTSNRIVNPDYMYRAEALMRVARQPYEPMRTEKSSFANQFKSFVSGGSSSVSHQFSAPMTQQQPLAVNIDLSYKHLTCDDE